MARTVADPRGVRWHVARRWFPWRPKLRRARWNERRKDRTTSWWDWIDLPVPAPDGLDDLGIVLAVIVAVVLFVFVVLPLTVFLIEVLLLGLLLAALAVVRTVLRRPWFVDAEPHDGSEPRRVWAIVGFRRSGDVVDAVASMLSRGGDDINVDGAVRVE